MAPIHEVKLFWNDQVHDTFMSIAQAAYQARGGQDPDLPGRGTVSGSRAPTRGSRSMPRASWWCTARPTA